MVRSTRELTPESMLGALGILFLFGLLTSCTLTSENTQTSEPSPAPTTQEPSAPTLPPPPPPPPAPIPVLPIEEAVLNAAKALLSQPSLPAVDVSSASRHMLVIDPIMDGVSGIQSKATRSLESRIIELVRTQYPQFSVQPFSAANVRKSPVVLIGTFTAINKQGQTTGQREAYRICLVLADLKSGTIVAKGTARARMEGIDHSPTPYFRDSPTWIREVSTESYINTCQASKVGEPIQSLYLDGIMAATLISEGIIAYESGRYREALDLYAKTLEMPAGRQLRVYNGLYLTNVKLGRKEATTEAFGKIVEHGLVNKRLAVKFLFKPGTTAFWPDRQVSGLYPMWLKQIAQGTSKTNSCLEITGHTSPSGPESLNERLSQLRAEHIKKQLEVEAPQLRNRTIASGAGSREALIGTGKDDMTDALDRRVVFQVHSC